MKKLWLLIVAGVFIVLGLSGAQCEVSTGTDSELKIGAIDVKKTAIDTSAYQVDLVFEVRGFEQKEDNGKFLINLVQDLETRDPNGTSIEQLTRKNFKRFSQTLDEETDQPVTFRNTLTIPLSFGTGTYEVILTVNDQNSGKSISTNTNFTLEPLS